MGLGMRLMMKNRVDSFQKHRELHKLEGISEE